MVVGVPVGAMQRCWQHLLQYHRVGGRLISSDLAGPDPGRADDLLEEPAGGLGVPPRSDEHVDDLAELVDRAVDVAPAPGDLHIRLVDLPAIPTRCRHGRAASASSGVKRSTHR
jgi:hypothetical protein